MRTYLTKRWGDGFENPSQKQLRSALAELSQRDGEHPNAWLTDEDGWTVDVYEGGMVLFGNPDVEGSEIEKNPVTPEGALALWNMLRNGERDKIRQWMALPAAKPPGGERLFDKSPEEILALLPSVLARAGAADVPSWHDDAGACCYRAHKLAAKDRPAAMAWAEVAVRFYEWVAQHAPTPDMLGSVESSMVIFRVSIIRKLGPLAGHPALDPRHVTRWFLARRTIPLEAVRGKTRSELYKLTPAQFGELRGMKTQLDFIRQLGEACPVPDLEQIQPWMEIARLLP